MTEAEKLADVVVAAVRASTAPMAGDLATMQARVVAIETQQAAFLASMTAMSDRLRQCETTMTTCLARLDALAAQMVAMEARGKSLEDRLSAITLKADDQLSAEDVTAAVTELFRVELGPIETVRRTEKRVVRDATGKIERIVEEVA